MAWSPVHYELVPDLEAIRWKRWTEIAFFCQLLLEMRLAVIVRHICQVDLT